MDMDMDTQNSSFRKAEAQERNARYYARNPQPNFRSFGRAQYVDEWGREYRLAPRSKSDPFHAMLYVRLPRHDVPWFQRPSEQITLTAVGGKDEKEEKEEQEIRVVHLSRNYLEQPGHRTGHIEIPAREAWW